MPQGNDVIDLTGLGADVFLESAVINGTDLVLTMNDGVIHTVDLTLAPDVYLSGAYIDSGDILNLPLNNGTIYQVDLSAYATVDTYVQSATVDGLTGLVTLTKNDGTTVTFDISGYVTNADVQLLSATYNCSLNQIELIETDGNVTVVDMTCFVDYMATQERGGVAYDSNKSYIAGDVTTVGDIAYISLTGASNHPAVNPADWALIALEERGGAAWSGSIQCSLGDVVTKNNLIYIALTPNQAVDPVGNPSDWREYNSVWHTAESGGNLGNSIHNPTGDVYPDNSLETLGAMWYVSGLGVGNTYTFTAGGLAGILVRDGDRLVWASGPVGTPAWVHSPVPVVSAERGGVAWSSVTNYIVGDIVTDPNGYGYKCILDITANPTTPAVDITHWVKAFRGGEYDATLVYEPGDIISYGGDIYIAPAGGIGPNVTPGTGAWINSTVDERGGVAWDSATTYAPGDMVSDGTLIYTAINGSTNSNPSTNPADWLIPSDPNNVERGGVAWEVTTDYVTGDFVTSTGYEIYTALVDNTGLLPESNPTQWQLVTRENGGIAHDATTAYIKGDIVSETIGSVETIFIARVNNNGVLPSSDPATWEEVISATTYSENGGVEWQSTTTYNSGDIAVEFSGPTPISYVALVPNVNIVPSLNLDAEWALVVPTEVGGRDWNINLDYLSGDVVTEAWIVYQAIAPNTGVAPAGAPATWQVVDKAGSLWDAGTNYELGDLASENGTIYVALTINSGSSPVANPLDWQAVNGSGLYDPAINYKLGDIVAENGVVYVAIQDTTGQPPSASPLFWQRADRGGELWDTDTLYRTGDIATLFDKAYVAKTDNSGSTPLINGDTADWKLDVVTVEDVLTSTSAINALSANMGRELEDNKIEADDYGTPTVGGTAKFEWNAGTQTLNIVTS